MNDKVQRADVNAQMLGMGAGQAQNAGQPMTQNLRGEAGEGLIQSERFGKQVDRLHYLMAQIGLRDHSPESETSDRPVDPTDLNWTIRTTASNLRAANNQLEELINLVEGELL